MVAAVAGTVGDVQLSSASSGFVRVAPRSSAPALNWTFLSKSYCPRATLYVQMIWWGYSGRSTWQGTFTGPLSSTMRRLAAFVSLIFRLKPTRNPIWFPTRKGLAAGGRGVRRLSRCNGSATWGAAVERNVTLEERKLL